MKTEQIKSIATLGSGDGRLGDVMYDAMMTVGQLLAKQNLSIITGGFGGAGMEAAPRGANLLGGWSVGYTMKGIPGNKYLTKIVDCQELSKDIPFFADFGIRLSGILTADGFIIAAGGGAGTMVEFFTCVQFNRKIWKKEGKQKRIAILKPASVELYGYDQEMLITCAQWGVLGDAGENIYELIKVVETPEEAVAWVTWQD